MGKAVLDAVPSVKGARCDLGICPGHRLRLGQTRGQVPTMQGAMPAILPLAGFTKLHGHRHQEGCSSPFLPRGYEGMAPHPINS